MHRKVVSVFSIICAAALMVSYCSRTDGFDAGENIEVATARAGISSAVYDNFEETSARAGVSTAIPNNLEVIYAAAASVSDSSVTATASAEEALMGYTNLGIANIEDGHLNVREEPVEDGHIVGKMGPDSACEIIGYEGDWAHITSGEVEGFVMASYLLTGEEAIQRAYEVYHTVATVLESGLRLRTEPNTESEILDTVAEGVELEVVAVEGDWVHIKLDSDDGYVSAQYVTVADQLDDAMTMDEIRFGMGVSDARVQLVNEALKYVGNPYVWGGTSLTNGCDCSGYVLSIYAMYGIYLPHSSASQANYGRRIDPSEAQPGDLFFYSRGGRGIGHVGIYIGGGKIVHASSERTGIMISNAFYATPLAVCNLMD
ncbi:MAG: C40 family peptidase [Lachnospiraceae bacterium]|nr:C40 family peptidase [Lachnospiraceae bacterium]